MYILINMLVLPIKIFIKYPSSCQLISLVTVVASAQQTDTVFQDEGLAAAACSIVQHCAALCSTVSQSCPTYVSLPLNNVICFTLPSTALDCVALSGNKELPFGSTAVFRSFLRYQKKVHRLVCSHSHAFLQFQLKQTYKSTCKYVVHKTSSSKNLLYNIKQ